MNELYFNMVRESLLKSPQKSQIMGNVSSDVNEKGKKAIGT